MDNNENIIKVYGADWCPDCYRVKFFLDNHGIKYSYINIEENEDARNFVLTANKDGFESIPVVVFPDRSILVEPTPKELINTLASLNIML